MRLTVTNNGLTVTASGLIVIDSGQSTDRSPSSITGVVSAAAVMESATHMVAYGIDLMYVRLSPAASFDGLDDSFPFALLVVLVATMTLGSVILRLFAVHRDVKVKWE
jgi:hypothetical protein